MLSTWKYIFNFLTDPGENKTGESFAHLPLTGAVLPILIINLIYISFVFIIGPAYMRNRQPYNLKKVLLLYNALQILINGYVVYWCFHTIVVEKAFELGCMMRLPENHYCRSTEAYIYYIYFLTKFLDYFDTIFFVLRKSYKQVSFLHVYHHLMMSTFAYIHIRSVGFGGHTSMVGVLNSFVHIFMYAYYLISSLSPAMKRTLWWKKYITLLQITQFVLLVVHQSWPLIMRPDCDTSKMWLVLSIIQAAIMLYLFGNFYANAYLRKESKIVDTAKSLDSTAKKFN